MISPAKTKRKNLAEILQRVPDDLIYNEVIRRRRMQSDAIAERILAAAAAAWNADVDTVRTASYARDPRLLHPRQASAALMVRAGLSQSTVSRFFGVTEGCISHALSAHKRRLSDPDYAMRFGAIDLNAQIHPR